MATVYNRPFLHLHYIINKYIYNINNLKNQTNLRKVMEFRTLMFTVGMVAGLDGNIVDGIVRINAGSAGRSRTRVPISRLGRHQLNLEVFVNFRKFVIQHHQIQNLVEE